MQSMEKSTGETSLAQKLPGKVNERASIVMMVEVIDHTGEKKRISVLFVSYFGSAESNSSSLLAYW
jgi:hypothetical protein